MYKSVYNYKNFYIVITKYRNKYQQKKILNTRMISWYYNKNNFNKYILYKISIIINSFNVILFDNWIYSSSLNILLYDKYIINKKYFYNILIDLFRWLYYQYLIIIFVIKFNDNFNIIYYQKIILEVCNINVCEVTCEYIIHIIFSFFLFF